MRTRAGGAPGPAVLRDVYSRVPYMTHVVWEGFRVQGSGYRVEG